jgi:AraC-like DNA-binding protein
VIDLVPQHVGKDTIFSLSPGQTLSISNESLDYVAIQFNREFYCVQDHDHEVSCNGMLFNGALATPMLHLGPEDIPSFGILLNVIEEEFAYKDEVQLEMLRTVLKRFIIKCTRLAKLQYAGKFISPGELDMVRHFSALVERHFKSLRKVTEYADLMNRSPKTLANAFKKLGELTPLQIIHARTILEAKKLLLFTDKSVKEISFELNVSDPVQFSRLFKKETGKSPGEFRQEGLLNSTKAMLSRDQV